MIDPKQLFDWLTGGEVGFFTGVPDSLLKDFCAYVTDNTSAHNHIIAANEGNAIGLAAGYHLATGKIPLVYLQNSGLGNTINPLLSLTDEKVYKIPLLLLIGWRGEPGVKDEPQHITQGELTLAILETLRIPYVVLSNEPEVASKQVKKTLNDIKTKETAHALVVRKDTFSKYSIKTKITSPYTMTREDALKILVDHLSLNDVVVSTTGKTSRELFEYRAAKGHPHHCDFLTVGSMGHSSQIALGIALAKPHQRVFCFDGDGAVLMHMGGLAIIGQQKPKNFFHVVINNGSHESVGGQPTVAFSIDIPTIARACGYVSTFSIDNPESLGELLKNIKSDDCPVLIEIKVKVGSRDNLGRPTIKPVNNKADFMEFLKKS